MTSHFDILDVFNKAMDKTTFPTPSKTTQKCIIATVMLTCFTFIFYVYYYPTTNFLKYIVDDVHVNNTSPETCLKVLRMQNYKCTINKTSDKPRADQDTILLIWLWPFGGRFDLEICGPRFNIHGCRLTDDPSLFDQAHGVMFHHRDIRGDLSNMPQLQRPAFQKWIWWNMESPSNSHSNGLLNSLFNLTSSYRRDSDVHVPYGSLIEATEEQKKYTIPKKDKLVCWIVSNFQPHYRRSQYYNELSEHIKVEAYGGHFNNRINNNDYGNVMSSCKFYLSFENSVHRDYFTEKLFNPLSLGTVPVVLGPTRENYEQFIPSEAFIHVDDFQSPKELADHLKLLDQNETLYSQYFTWRQHFVTKLSAFGPEHACRICEHLRRKKGYTVVKNLIGWYWG